PDGCPAEWPSVGFVRSLVTRAEFAAHLTPVRPGGRALGLVPAQSRRDNGALVFAPPLGDRGQRLDSVVRHARAAAAVLRDARHARPAGSPSRARPPLAADPCRPTWGRWPMCQ